MAVQPPPPPGKLVAAYLRTCDLPVTLLAVPPPKYFDADVSIASFSLHASRFSARRAVNICVERADVEFGAFQLQRWHGTGRELGQRASSFYSKTLERQLPALVTAASVGGNHVVSP